MKYAYMLTGISSAQFLITKFAIDSGDYGTGLWSFGMGLIWLVYVNNILRAESKP